MHTHDINLHIVILNTGLNSTQIQICLKVLLPRLLFQLLSMVFEILPSTNLLIEVCISVFLLGSSSISIFFDKIVANLLKYTPASLSKIASHYAIIGVKEALLSNAALEYLLFLICFFLQKLIEEFGC